MARYKKGIISQDLRCVSGFTHKKGSTVYYQRIKTVPDRHGFKLTDYEWYYLDENQKNLVRTTKRIIEGLEFIQEPFRK